MIDGGLAPGQAKSAFIAQMLAECGLRADAAPKRQEIHLYAAEGADDGKRWLQIALAGERRETNDWIVSEANVWGGGSDRLFLGTNVLAFLVNSQGEPSFRGTHLWICNLGSSPVYVTSLATGQNNRELLHGRDEVVPLAESGTGIPLSVRCRRTLR